MLHTSSASGPASTAGARHINVPQLADALRCATERWHLSQEQLPDSDTIEHLLMQLHRANFDLWHEEDKARDPAASDATIAGVKRSIDKLNQQRNDTVERIDTQLLALAGEQNTAAPLHSETPGLILDRLSILQLKIFHTLEETQRTGVPASHVERNQQRLAVLQKQSADLAHCLGELWSEVLGGRRRFQVYRQLKMYNDPALNPVIYRNTAPSSVR